MARIEDIPRPTRDVVLALACPDLPGAPWVVSKPLAECRIAILTSAALTSTHNGFNTVGSRFIVPVPWVAPA